MSDDEDFDGVDDETSGAGTEIGRRGKRGHDDGTDSSGDEGEAEPDIATEAGDLHDQQRETSGGDSEGDGSDGESGGNNITIQVSGKKRKVTEARLPICRYVEGDLVTTWLAKQNEDEEEYLLYCRNCKCETCEHCVKQ